MSAVLVIEDDDRIRLSLQLALEDEGHTARGAATAEEGLVCQRQEPADTVLVDLMLPGARRHGPRRRGPVRVRRSGGTHTTPGRPAARTVPGAHLIHSDAGPVRRRPAAAVSCQRRELVAVTRHIDRVPTVDVLVAHLLAGPTDTERDAGLTSALLSTTVVSSVDLADRQATIELASPIEGTGCNDEVLASAQLVCTLTARPEVSGVTFTQRGQPIGVPRADGSLSGGTLTAADYATLIAPK